MSERNCDNCRYYKEHYIKHTTYFLRIGGHCTNSQLKVKKWKSDCKFWETIEIRRAERKEAIKVTLKKMEQHLADIVAILKDE